MYRIGKPIEIENRLVVARACKDRGVTVNGYMFFFWHNENVLKLIEEMIAQLFDILKTTECTLKMHEFCGT